MFDAWNKCVCGGVKLSLAGLDDVELGRLIQLAKKSIARYNACSHRSFQVHGAIPVTKRPVDEGR